MKKFAFLLILILFLTNISALCEEGQIDINTASLEELDQLYGIGPVKAQAIIDTRPLISVDDLIRVNGIGEATLSGIKTQGLACVENEGENNSENTNVTNEDSKEDSSQEPINTNNNSTDNINEESTVNSESNNNIQAVNENLNEIQAKKESSVIILNSPKDIKTEKDSEKDSDNETWSEADKTKYALYGLFSFCILLSVLWALKMHMENKKNEFR